MNIRLLFQRCRRHCWRVSTNDYSYTASQRKYYTSYPVFPPDPDVLKFLRYEDGSMPEYFNFSQFIEEWALREAEGERGSNPALWWTDHCGNEVKWRFSDLLEKSKKLANMLVKSCYLQKGDVVSTILPQIPEWWLVNLGCQRAGLVCSPGTVLLTAKDIEYRLNKSKTACVIVTEDKLSAVQSVTDNCPDLKHKIVVRKSKQSPVGNGWLDFDDLFNSASGQHDYVKTKSTDPMLWFFTSGTTNLPKIVEQTHGSWGIGNYIPATQSYNCKPTEVLWNIGDTGWSKGAFGTLFAPWILGCCTFVRYSPQFDPVNILKTLEKYPITSLCVPPTGFRMIVQENLSDYTLTNTLKTCFSVGESVDLKLVHKWKENTGICLQQAYGQSETSMITLVPPEVEDKAGSIGRPTTGSNACIVDDDCLPVGPDVEGAIAIKVRPNRPIWLFSKYVGEPGKTGECFKGDYYLTGDRGMMDGDGFIWFRGRTDDVINSSAYRIGPAEVEAVINSHPAVVESAVVSSPDYLRGEVVKAFIILKTDFKCSDEQKLTEEIQNYVKENTAPYKYPRKVQFVDELPRTIIGKLKRSELKNREWDGYNKE